jgi:hypothetical protein
MANPEMSVNVATENEISLAADVAAGVVVGILVVEDGVVEFDLAVVDDGDGAATDGLDEDLVVLVEFDEPEGDDNSVAVDVEESEPDDTFVDVAGAGDVTVAADAAGAGAVVIVAVEPPVAQSSDFHNDASATLAFTPGSESPVTRSGVAPVVHTQHGSPSSWPFVWPSPSESAWQSASVHLLPAFLNAVPKSLRSLSDPSGSRCPTAGTFGTSAPFGMRATNLGDADAVESIAAAQTAPATKKRSFIGWDCERIDWLVWVCGPKLIEKCDGHSSTIRSS